jgi:hypothetical protein
MSFKTRAERDVVIKDAGSLCHERTHCWTDRKDVAIEFTTANPFGLVLKAVAKRKDILLDSSSDLGRELWPEFKAYKGTEYIFDPSARLAVVEWFVFDRD